MGQGQPQVVSAPSVFFSIKGGEDIGFEWLYEFQWSAFANGGYMIKAKILDPMWNILRSKIVQDYLREGRNEPTEVEFAIYWDPDTRTTGKQVAIVTDITAKEMTQTGGYIEFIAIDPPSYYLNCGDSAGTAFKGKVSSVIRQIIQKYWVDPFGKSKYDADFDVSDTIDADTNTWYMHRQDPKTFISSLLDWSASVTHKKTNWIVSSDGSIDDNVPTLEIKEQADKEPQHYGLYIINTKPPAGADVMDFTVICDNYISSFQKQTITQGISAISGKYWDRKADKDRKVVHVYDDNTAEKYNVSISEKQGFKKPSKSTSPDEPHDWSTPIMAIPEHNAGDLGKKYKDYIDGRARQLFLQMLNMVMRIKIRVQGEYNKDLANAHNLGVSTMSLAFLDADNEIYLLQGDWLVYGFRHIVTRERWDTDLFAYRLDYDANAKKLHEPAGAGAVAGALAGIGGDI
jgi:hypothetical protein